MRRICVKFILLLLALVLNGCAGNSYWTWEHPQGLGSQQLQKDELECRRLAEREANISSYRYYYYDYPYYDLYAYRGRHHPAYYDWTWYNHYRFIQYQDDLDRYFRVCMTAKGWQLVRKEKTVQQPPVQSTPADKSGE